MIGGGGMFEDRSDAGRRLALAMQKFRREEPIVLAIPRGGVEVGYQLARNLHAELDVVVARKLPYPQNTEAGFGAIAEDGSTFIFPGAFDIFSKQTINQIIHEQEDELYRRIGALRAGHPLPDVEGRTVILVDDGVAMGSTMRVCITLCKNRKAGKIIVASPVAGVQTAKELSALSDEVVILDTPANFCAVAQAYVNWYDVSDRKVIDIMHQWEYEKVQVIGH
jgi:putative phosphoribosyl transferase